MNIDNSFPIELIGKHDLVPNLGVISIGDPMYRACTMPLVSGYDEAALTALDAERLVVDPLPTMEPVDVPAPSVDILGDTRRRLEGVLAKLSTDAPGRVDAEKLLHVLKSADGRVSFEVLLDKQPSARDIRRFPKAADALMTAAWKKMASSKYQFPAPALVDRALKTACKDWLPRDVAAVRHRIFFALSKLNFTFHGFALSIMLKRVVETSPKDLEGSLRDFLMGSSDGHA